MKTQIVHTLMQHRLMFGTVMVTALAALIVHGSSQAVNESGALAAAPAPALYQPTTTATLPIIASGLVTAADEAVIRAQTNGVVVAVPAYEGMAAVAGTVLVTQDQPVAAAQLAQASANTALVTAQQQAAVSRAQSAATVSVLQGESATVIATLRVQGADAATNEAAARLLVALRAATLQITASADFVDIHRSFFSSTGLRTYRTMLEALYNAVPDYFSDGVTRSTDGNATDILATLTAMEANGQYDSVALLALAHSIDAELTVLETVFGSGAGTVFDERTIDPNSSAYSAYLTHQAALIGVQDDVRTALGGLRSVATSADETQTTEHTAVRVSEVDVAEAVRQAKLAETIATYARQAAVATESVAAAQVALGTSRAPFVGTVAAVAVKPGAYVTVGTPLVTLVGSGARELTVRLPQQFAGALAVGQAYQVSGETVGTVDRFSSVAHQGVVTAVINITDPNLPVGSSVTGHVLVAPEQALTAVPYAYLHFDSIGAYVMDDRSERTAVTIVYDDATMYYITESLQGMSLVSAFGTRVGA